MARKRRKDSTFNRTLQAVVRVLIACYFISGAAGLIPGMDLTPLAAQVLDTPWDGMAASLSVFALSLLILAGHMLRPAALLLSIAVFWSSYMQAVSLGIDGALGTFWRDLALIGALLLTYTETDTREAPARKLFRRKPRARRIGDRVVLPKRVPAPDQRANQPVRFPRPQPQTEPNSPPDLSIPDSGKQGRAS